VNLLEVAIPSLVGFIVAIISTLWIIKTSSDRGLVGKDVNKPNKPEVPLLGGVATVSGFVAGSFTLLALNFSLAPLVEPIPSLITFSWAS